jgi:GT2 family glycosyltransferase
VTRVAVVIPNWNGRAWLPGCLDSLAGQTRAADQVIVVDNGSDDGSLELLRNNYGWVNVIELGRNTGFAVACNRGVAAAEDADLVALVNSDVVLAGDWLERMLAAPTAGDASVACKMVDLADPGLIYDAGDVLRRDGAAEQRGRFLPDDGRWDDPGEVFSACGGAALYRRDAFLAAGGFDERFFLYLEDVDLGLRLRTAGWTCRYEPRAVARHAGGASSSRLATPLPSWVERNTLLLVAKAFPLRWLPLVAYRQLAWAWHAARRGDGALADFARGAAAALPLLPRYLLRERPKLRGSARVPVEQAVPDEPIRGPAALGYEASRSSTA